MPSQPLTTPSAMRLCEDELVQYLGRQFGDGIEVPLEQVESMIGRKLPKRALRPSWWAVPPRKTALLSRPWHRAGFRAEFVPAQGVVRFVRRSRPAPGWEYESYGRWIYFAGGGRRRRYTAIDPMGLTFHCTCGKQTCIRKRHFDFRDHITELYRAIGRAYDTPGGLSFEWSSVSFALKLGASIRDVDAYTGYVEDPTMFALCELSGDSEDADSEMASKYVAAASIFNFLWQAYESAVRLTEPSELRGLLKEGRLGERGRRLFEAHPQLDRAFFGLDDSLAVAVRMCSMGKGFDDRLDKVEKRFPTRNLAMAAELAREFRNFIAHGEDEVPGHPDWCANEASASHARLRRFYAIGRLLLLLIQGLAWLSVSPTAVAYDYWDEDVNLQELLKSIHLKQAC